MAIQIKQPFEMFFNKDGSPLNDGNVYIGIAGLNPETSPISIFSDPSMTIPVAQPLKTTNGYISINGSARDIFAQGDYSITVKDKSGVLMYSSLTNNEDGIVSYVDNVSDLANFGNTNTSSPVIVKDLDRGGTFVWSATGTVNGGTVFAGATGYWIRQYSSAINAKWFGVVGDNTTLNSVAMQSCIDYAVSSKQTIEVTAGNYLFEATLILYAGLTIKGKGGAIQQGVTFKVNSNIAMFNTGIATFAAESMEFENINFSSITAGQGTAFYAPSTVFISQTTFRNCAWSSNLLYGINAPIILCKFYDCDFGTYPGTVQNFIGINAVGTLSSREPNANTFYSCVFRRSNALHMINIATGGVQWLFIACDFEQNACTQEVIRNDGAGALTFLNGYAESNTTPYFVHTHGVLISYFTNVVSFKNMHFNNPCTDSILKREIIYPDLEITGCYGQLNCNLIKNETNVLNDANDVALSVGNHFNVGTGSTGDIATLTGVVTAYHAGNFQAKQPVVPSFSAYSNAAQAISATTWTKINFLTVLSESPHNYYDQVNARFSPQKAGKYQISVCQAVVVASATAFLQLAVYKNGALYKYIAYAGGTTNYPIAVGSCMIDANGTTDYFEIYAYSSGAYNLWSGVNNTYFSGHYIGA